MSSSRLPVPRRTLLQMGVCAGASLAGVARGQASGPILPTYAQLVGNRFVFDHEGRVLLPVRMMEDKSRVRFAVGSGTYLLTHDAPPRPLPPGTLTVTRMTGTAARVADRYILETLENASRRDARARQTAWKKAGVRCTLKRVGGVYGMRGTVFDNRAFLVLSTRMPPVRVQKRLNARPVKEAFLERAPTVRFRIAHESGLRVEVDQLAGILAPRDEAVRAFAVEHSIGYKTHGFADRDLRELLVVTADRHGQLALVNLVHDDTLVAGILPSEMFASAPLEALKAQAVTARGEVFAKIGRRHFTDPYLLCSEQHCQVYKGKTAETPRTTRAAHDTAGELAFLGTRIVDSVYSACCGGHTEPGHIVWDRPKSPALVGTIDAPTPRVAPPRNATQGPHQAFFATTARPQIPADLSSDWEVRRFLDIPRTETFCGRSSFNQKGDAYRWARRFSAQEIDQLVAPLGVGTVKSLRVTERGPGGRLRALKVVGSRKTAQVQRELPVRRLFRNLRSGLLVIDMERGPDGALTAVTFRGAGFGHGSGMCQQGAIGMAEVGYDYHRILAHYFAGAEVRGVF